MIDIPEIKWFADQLNYSDPLSYTTDKEHIFQLALKAREIDAQNILEIGSCFGISTAVIAYACPNAKIYSVDLCIDVLQSYRDSFWQYLKLTNIIAIQDSAANYLISCKKTNKTFDFVFLDAAHGDQVIPEYLIAYGIVNKGGYFTCHDWDQITDKETLIEYWNQPEFSVLKDDKNRELLMIKK
jgi:predicted O-methyltransferase YrrM